MAGKWSTTVASDVSSRNGLGWELTRQDGSGEVVWEVFREDSGPFPILTATRSGGGSLRDASIHQFTSSAVADLLGAVGLHDVVGWQTKNISAALVLAAATVVTWQGQEWAVESGPGNVPLAWALPEDERTPFAWLRYTTVHGEGVVTTYQDDAVFGLCFVPNNDPHFPAEDVGILRSRRGLPLPEGEIVRVSVAYDTTVHGTATPGLLTEVRIQGTSQSTLLIAGEAYSRDE